MMKTVPGAPSPVKVAIEKVDLPPTSMIAALAATEAFSDHTDAFRARVDVSLVPDVDAFAHAFLEQDPPAWITAAMRARDAVVGTLFGLKTARDVAPGDRANLAGRPRAISAPSALEPGVRRGIFQILKRSREEILLGEDDRHLDFRVSLFHERLGEEALVTVSTVVRFHNTLGRAYFLPVRPVHGHIVPAMMRRALRGPPRGSEGGARGAEGHTP